MIRGITFADQLTTSDDFSHLQNKWFNGVSGITKGCEVSADADNLYVGAGYFLIAGRLVRIVGTETIASDVVEVAKKTVLVFEIDLSKTNSTTVFNQGYFKLLADTDDYPTLIQEDLDNGGTVYQMEFARFVKTTTSITEFESRTIPLSVSEVWSRLESEFNSDMDQFNTYFDEQTQSLETWIDNTKTEIDNEWNNIKSSIDTEVDTKINELNKEIQKVQDGSLVTVGEFRPTVTYSMYKSNLDNNGIYTTVTYKRADGSTYKVSQLSNINDNGNYTTQTITYYLADGTTVDKTEVYSINYNADGDVESEVLTNA